MSSRNSPEANDLSPRFRDLTLSLTSNDKLIEFEVSIVGRSSSKFLYSGRSFLVTSCLTYMIDRSSTLGLGIMLLPWQLWQHLKKTTAIKKIFILNMNRLQRNELDEMGGDAAPANSLAPMPRSQRKGSRPIQMSAIFRKIGSGTLSNQNCCRYTAAHSLLSPPPNTIYGNKEGSAVCWC